MKGVTQLWLPFPEGQGGKGVDRLVIPVILDMLGSVSGLDKDEDNATIKIKI